MRVFDSNLAAVQLFRDKVKLNKPIAVGYSVLELSKMKMYDFWYDVLQEGFKEFKISLLMSDYDSFLVHTEGGSATQLGQRKCFADFASLETGHSLKDETNRQVPGKMKLQLPNAVIVETVVLSSKCYSVLTDRGSLSAMKGVPGSLQHDIYKDCIQSDKCYVGRIRSTKNCGQSLYHVSTE